MNSRFHARSTSGDSMLYNPGVGVVEGVTFFRPLGRCLLLTVEVHEPIAILLLVLRSR